ncbi:MFS transporter [Thermoleophilia bacterium SCSIO 60948]|nr:MFS transporter [Thermoleophilia bacterium SCSIO 60948]
MSASTNSSPTAGAGRVGAAGAALVLLIACVAQFMLVLDDTIVNVALPSIGGDLALEEASLSWVVNAYLLTFGGFLLIGGRLADRFGAKRLFLLSLGGFALASAVCGAAPSSGVLIGARAAQGVTAALLSPAALALLLTASPEGPQRRRALGIWAGLLGAGAVSGLLVGGALVEFADWRWIFLVNLPVAAAALLVARRVLPADDPSRARSAPNIAGATLATLALLTFVFTVVETDGAGWGSARTLAGFGVALALAVAFVISERRSDSPLVPPELLRRRRAISADGVVFLAAGGLLAMFFFQTLYMQRVLGYSALETGAAFLPFSLSMGAVSAIAGRLGELDPRIPIVGGLALTGGALWLMSGLDPASAYLGAVLPTLALAGAGLGLALVPVIGLATGDAEERDGGLASGLMTSCQQIGGAVGIAVMTTIATSQTESALGDGAAVGQALSDGFSLAFRFEAGVMALGVIAAIVLLGPRRGERSRGREVAASPAA